MPVKKGNRKRTSSAAKQHRCDATCPPVFEQVRSASDNVGAFVAGLEVGGGGVGCATGLCVGGATGRGVGLVVGRGVGGATGRGVGLAVGRGVGGGGATGRGDGSSVVAPCKLRLLRLLWSFCSCSIRAALPLLLAKVAPPPPVVVVVVVVAAEVAVVEVVATAKKATRHPANATAASKSDVFDDGDDVEKDRRPRPRLLLVLGERVVVVIVVSSSRVVNPRAVKYGAVERTNGYNESAPSPLLHARRFVRLGLGSFSSSTTTNNRRCRSSRRHAIFRPLSTADEDPITAHWLY